MMGFLFGLIYLVFFNIGGPSFFYSGLAVVLLGELIRLWASLVLVKIEKLSTEGIYSSTRNPLYFGSFIVGLGFIVMTFGSGGYLPSFILFIFYFLFFGYIYLKTIGNEEYVLAEKYGAAFEEYKRNTGRFFPSGFPSGIGPVSIDRFFINREYKTIAGILLIIALILLKFIIFPLSKWGFKGL